MSSLNKVQIIGRLGKDPAVKTLQSGQKVANISVATDESYKDKDGNKVEKTEWHNVTVWGKLAEVCEKWLHRGDLTYFEGKLQTRKYEKDGVDHYATDIVASEMRMLGGKRSEASAPASGGGAAPAPEDDLPF